ncbi:MAG: acyl-CoA dehydrogenase family protein [Pseudomonadota bacterium]
MTPKAQQAFRTDVARWLSEHRPPAPDFLLPQTFMEVGSEAQLDYLRDWQHAVWSAGFLGMAWPTEYGGQGAEPAYQQIVDDEMRKQRVPIMFNAIGLGWAGPLINDIGSAEAKQRYLKPILTGEDVWCQGFSEPDHGSDLGSIQCRAIRDGDSYIVNGQKTWTTMGNFGKYMILLARTDANTERKYAGLSFFLAPLQVAGVDTRPIKKLTGDYGFTETFFSDARIPADSLMGAEGQGWAIAMQTLQYERGAEAGAAGGLMLSPVRVADVICIARETQRNGAPAIEDALVRDALVALVIEEKALLASAARAGISALCADFPNSLPLSSKLRMTEFQRRLRQFAVGLQGAGASLYVGDRDAYSAGFWQRAYLNNFSTTIGGGTSQIQANIVAEHVLGLPKG